MSRCDIATALTRHRHPLPPSPRLSPQHKKTAQAARACACALLHTVALPPPPTPSSALPPPPTPSSALLERIAAARRAALAAAGGEQPAPLPSPASAAAAQADAAQAARLPPPQSKHILICASASGTTYQPQDLAAAARASFDYLRGRLDALRQASAAATTASSSSSSRPQVLLSRVDSLDEALACHAAATSVPPLSDSAAARLRAAAAAAGKQGDDQAAASGGPWAVVLPEAVVYRACSPLVLERVVNEHLFGGRIVADHVVLAAAEEDEDDEDGDGFRSSALAVASPLDPLFAAERRHAAAAAMMGNPSLRVRPAFGAMRSPSNSIGEGYSSLHEGGR